MNRFQDFVGTWDITRMVNDLRAETQFQFTGQATITNGLYHEVGKMVLADGTSLNAERKYQWHDLGTGVEVRFADGKFFHFFVYTTCTQGVHHQCIQDSYTGTYEFGAWPQWQVVWNVTGPAKDYSSVTQYSSA